MIIVILIFYFTLSYFFNGYTNYDKYGHNNNVVVVIVLMLEQSIFCKGIYFIED